MAIKILAEDIGLPKDASEEQMAERIRTFPGEVATWKGRADEYERLLGERTADLARFRGKEKELDHDRGKLFVDRLVADQYIDGDEREYWETRYISDPEGTKKFMEGRKHRAILSRQVSLSGDSAPPDDPQVELSIRVAEMMANDTAKTLTEAVAVQRIYKDDPGLFHRVTEARRAKAASKGGER